MITKVGVGILLIDEYDHILLGQRKGSHGEGEWAAPGGHVDYMEDVYTAAHREILEEVGPDIFYEDLHIVCVANLVKYAPKHYVDFGMVAKYRGGKPRVMEPDKISEWSWVDMNNIPDPAFGLVRYYVDAYNAGHRIEMITL